MGGYKFLSVGWLIMRGWLSPLFLSPAKPAAAPVDIFSSFQISLYAYATTYVFGCIRTVYCTYSYRIRTYDKKFTSSFVLCLDLERRSVESKTKKWIFTFTVTQSLFSTTYFNSLARNLTPTIHFWTKLFSNFSKVIYLNSTKAVSVVQLYLIG